MAVLTLLGWSSIPLFLKHFTHSMDAWTSNGWRYGFAALLWLPWIVVSARRGKLPAGIWKAALVPSAFNAAGQALFTAAHYRINPGLLSFGMRTQLVSVAVGAYLLFPSERRVIRFPGFWGGCALVLAGILTTVFAGGETPRASELVGVAEAIVAGSLFAAYSLGVRRNMSDYRSAISFAVISLLTALPMVGLMLAFGRGAGVAPLEIPAAQLGILLLSAVIGIALGHLFYYMAIARLGVAVSTAILQLQPFCVAFASIFLFGEVLRPAQWAGGLAAVAGAVLILEVQRRLSEGAPQS